MVTAEHLHPAMEADNEICLTLVTQHGAAEHVHPEVEADNKEGVAVTTRQLTPTRNVTRSGVTWLVQNDTDTGTQTCSDVVLPTARS